MDVTQRLKDLHLLKRLKRKRSHLLWAYIGSLLASRAQIYVLRGEVSSRVCRSAKRLKVPDKRTKSTEEKLKIETSTSHRTSEFEYSEPKDRYVVERFKNSLGENYRKRNSKNTRCSCL